MVVLTFFKYMSVCVGFVMCGCFDNCVGVLVICVLVFTVFLYCFVYVYLFLCYLCKDYCHRVMIIIIIITYL